MRLSFYNYVYARLSDQYQGEARELKARKVCKWIFDFAIYSGSTIFAFVAFSNENWFPPKLGGSGREEQVLTTYPYWPADRKFVQEFYLIHLGLHMFSFLELAILRNKEEPKFWEYILHHFMAAALLFYSLMFNII